jgi:uncharacterized protein (DUF305 family)
MRKSAMLLAGMVLIVAGLAGLAFVFLAAGPHAAGGDRADAHFIEQMIPHHDDAIAMSELALERSQTPEIRRLAEDIRRSQTAENGQMREWYRDWYGREVPENGSAGGMMGAMMMRDTTDLQALEDAPDFDREFLEQMIPHHEMAVMMTSMGHGGREELSDLKDAMRRQQSREIELMERWYRDWYGQ